MGSHHISVLSPEISTFYSMAFTNAAGLAPNRLLKKALARHCILSASTTTKG
jgi:hypothetical protein